MNESSASLEPGSYKLEQIQTISATKNLSLSEKNLSPFRTSLGLVDLGVHVDPTISDKRLNALRTLQSNEPFRPFLELLLNSVDYSKNKNPKIQVRLAEMKDGGWQIVIQDKPEGVGMASDDLLNKYLDPYASGSAETRQTPSGNWKKGLMGVGAQQQISLLKNPGDEIYISAAKAGEITLAKLELAKNDVSITLGGKKDEQAREGVMQIIRLSDKTAKEIGFTPDTFGEYLGERLAISDGFGLSMHTVAKSEDQTKNKQVSQKELVSIEKPGLTTVGNEDTKIIFSSEKGNEAKVYLNVLGVRVGEPIVVAGANLPKTVDLRFEYPIETITEGRRATGLTKKNVHDLIKSVQDISLVPGGTNKEKAQSQLVLLTTLLPMYEQYEKDNRWRTQKGLSIESALKDTVKNVLKGAHEAGVQMLPQSLHPAVPVSPTTVLIPDTFIENDGLVKAIEETGFEKVKGLYGAAFKAKLSIDEPFFISPQGVLFVNSDYFETIDEAACIKIRALLLNRKDSGVLKDAEKWKIVQTTPLKDLGVEAPTPVVAVDVLKLEQSKQEGVITPQKTDNQIKSEEIYKKNRELAFPVRDRCEKLTQDWKNLRYEEKKQGINDLIKMTHIDNSSYMESLKNQAEELDGRYFSSVQRSPNGFYYLKPGDFSDEAVLRSMEKRWFELPEEELDNYWQVLQVAFNWEHAVGNFYFPKGADAGILGHLSNFPTNFHFTEDCVYQLEASRSEYRGNGLGISDLFIYDKNILHLAHKYKTILPSIGDFDSTIHRAFEVSEIDGLFQLFTEHAQEMSALYALSSEEQEDFVAFFTDKNNRWTQFKERFSPHLITWGEPDLNAYDTYVPSLVSLIKFPQEAVYLEKMYEEYEYSAVYDASAYSACYAKDFGLAQSPKALYTQVLPFITNFPAASDIPHILYGYSGSEDVLRLNDEERNLWEILHGQYKLTVSKSIPIPPDGATEIDPAILPMLKISERSDELTKAIDINSYLSSLNFPIEKLAVRRRELLHPILHLDQTPGNSYFELLKNSWQAISRDESLPKDQRKIEITDFTTPRGNEDYYGFSLRDYVGMDPREALFKLIVPGFGEGVHGLHFLTVLKDTDFITVTTSKGGVKGTIFLESIKNADGQVVNFKLNYSEEKNNEGFKGTNVMAWRKVKPESAQIEAALFRARIKDFGSNIPLSRVNIQLNGEQVNTNAPIYTQTAVENLGTVEFKPKERYVTQIAVDDMPVTSYDLNSAIVRSGLPDLGKDLLRRSGLLVNIINCAQPITRDNAGFVNSFKVSELLGKAINNNIEPILTQMLKKGSIDFDSVLPTEVWYDDRFSLYSDQYKFDLSNKESAALWMLTRPIYSNDGKNFYSLAYVIQNSIKGTLQKEIYESLPMEVKEKLKKRPAPQQIESRMQRNLEMPHDIVDFLKQVTEKAESVVSLPSTTNPPIIQMHAGSYRGMENRAMYSGSDDCYSWNKNMTGTIRTAQSGHFDSLAEVFLVATHEAEHRKRRSDNDLFYHTPEFYKSVEKAVLALPQELNFYAGE